MQSPQRELPKQWEVRPKVYAVDLRVKPAASVEVDTQTLMRHRRDIEVELERVMATFKLVCYGRFGDRLYFGSPRPPFLRSLGKLGFFRLFDTNALHLLPDIEGEADYYVSGFAPHETKALLSDPKAHRGTPDLIQALQQVEFLAFDDYKLHAAALGLTPIPEGFFKMKLPYE